MRGFIAITAVLIMSALLSALVFAASTNIFWTRQNQTDAAAFAAAKISASACIYAALAAFEDDQTYHPSHQILYIDAMHTCTIDSLTFEDNSITIIAHAKAADSAAAFRGILPLSATGKPLLPLVITAYF